MKIKAIRKEKNSALDFDYMYNTSGEFFEDSSNDFVVEEESVTEAMFERKLVNETINDVSEELKLPYKLQEFQKESVYHIVNGRNVILISPTGSGKLIVIYIALRVKEILTGTTLVTVGCEPTQNIIKEKLEDPPLPSASVGMKGSLDFSDEKEILLSHTKEEIESGTYKIVFGYEESWSHPIGEKIIESLADQNKIAFVFHDECHQNLPEFWGEWRQEMMLGLSEIRLLAGRPNSLFMSATLTSSDCTKLKRMSGLRRNIVTIKRSPVMNHIKFVTIERPSNQKGSGISGKVDSETSQVEMEIGEGILAPILQCFLEKWCQDVENGREPKIGMVISENTDDLVAVQEYLFCRLGNGGFHKPWVLVTSKTGNVTKRRVRKNGSHESGILKLYLSTSVLMQGIDFHRVDVVLISRPYPHLHSLLQAAGRGGRKLQDGRRRLVALYQLWNQEDIVLGRKGMQETTTDFCQTFNCLREYLKEVFSDNSVSDKLDMWCCGNCDVRVSS